MESTQCSSARALLRAGALTAMLLLSGHVTAETKSPIGIVLAAGDIGNCFSPRSQYIKVANLVSNEIKKAGKIPVAIIALGDIAYSNNKGGKLIPPYYKECMDKFAKTWGLNLDKIWPVPGNHDYSDDGVTEAGIFGKYFSGRLKQLSGNPEPTFFYARKFPEDKIGAWLLAGVNFYRERKYQLKWLESQIDDSGARCILVFTHPFLNSSGHHGSANSSNMKNMTYLPMKPLLNIMYKGGVTVLLTAHEHDFEQFAKQNADGKQALDGVRAFVVGTGGAPLYPVAKDKNLELKKKHPLSQAFGNESHGILKLELYANEYSWSFISAHGPAISLPVTHESCNKRQMANE